VEVDGNLFPLGAAAAQTVTFHPFQENRLELSLRIQNAELEWEGDITVKRGNAVLTRMAVRLPKHEEERQRIEIKQEETNMYDSKHENDEPEQNVVEKSDQWGTEEASDKVQGGSVPCENHQDVCS
jgi:hypothetical protein